MSSIKASAIHRQLRGLVCLYKPADVCTNFFVQTFGENLCRELNRIDKSRPFNYLDIQETETGLSVDIRPSYSDSVLASGPRYTEENTFLRLSSIGKRTSGVCILGINEGIKHLIQWKNNNPLKTLHVKGKLGVATANLYKDEKVVGRCRYDKIDKAVLDKVLSSFEAAHQRKIYEALNIDIHTQEAYELASKGMLRPPVNSFPCIYSMKCIHFESPYFTLEIICLNDNENYLLSLIHDLGLQLRSLAHCIGIRCIRFGPFNLKNALLCSQLSINNILKNVKECGETTRTYMTHISRQHIRKFNCESGKNLKV